MKSIFHPASERGSADFGWLDSKHSFSFGHWHNPYKMGFGALRVLNDDIVAPSMGFSTHPHNNMEIISIPLFGELAHKDSIGTNGVIRTGDVQIMSAGTGIKHSEFNNSHEKKVNFLQIWILPKKLNIEPRYEQKTFSEKDREGRWQTIVSPNSDSSVQINQYAYLSLVKLEPKEKIIYEMHSSGQGVYFFLISGKIKIEDISMERRDALGIYETKLLNLESEISSEILAIEVPM